MEYLRYTSRFLPPETGERFRELIRQNEDLFGETSGYGGLGPRYRIIHGDAIAERLPEIAAFGEQVIRPVVEAFAGKPLRPPRDHARALRIQVFDQPQHSFRWHYDNSSFAALLILENTNAGETQVIPPLLSRVLRPAFYALYWAPQVFSFMPRRVYDAQAGDLIVLCGTRLLHRGVSSGAHGERIVILFAYDELDYRPNRLRLWFGHRMNGSRYENAG